MLVVTEITNVEEKLADYAHTAWSGWMSYLFLCSVAQKDGSVVIPKDKAERWHRQMSTDYNDLPEKEKHSDRTEAKLIIDILQP